MGIPHIVGPSVLALFHTQCPRLIEKCSANIIATSKVAIIAAAARQLTSCLAAR